MGHGSGNELSPQTDCVFKFVGKEMGSVFFFFFSFWVFFFFFLLSCLFHLVLQRINTFALIMIQQLEQNKDKLYESMIVQGLNKTKDIFT